MAQLLRALNVPTEFKFLSEREPPNNSESNIIVNFKTLCLKGHSYSSEEKVVEKCTLKTRETN